MTGPSPKGNYPAKRKCLRCQKLFQSKGAYNRICSSCTSVNSQTKDNTREIKDPNRFIHNKKSNRGIY